jgi:hypothetical protein
MISVRQNPMHEGAALCAGSGRIFGQRRTPHHNARGAGTPFPNVMRGLDPRIHDDKHKQMSTATPVA